MQLRPSPEGTVLTRPVKPSAYQPAIKTTETPTNPYLDQSKHIFTRKSETYSYVCIYVCMIVSNNYNHKPKDCNLQPT